MDFYTKGLNGHKVKLIDNQDGTKSFSARAPKIPMEVKVPNKVDVQRLEESGYPLFVDEDDILYYEKNGFLYSMNVDGTDIRTILKVSDIDADLDRVSWFAKTRKSGRYILSLKKHPKQKGQIWVADSLDGPWEKKLDAMTIEGLGNSEFRHTNCWHHFDGVSDIIIVGSYCTYDDGLNPSPCNHVYLSLDEGETFELIFQPPTINPENNRHIHALAYSPWDAYIWVAYGDGDNRGVSYSYDMGKNWVTVSEGDFGKGGWQPSSVVPLIDQVAFGTDNPLYNGVLVWNRPRETEEVELRYAWQKINFDGKVLISRKAASISATEAYIPLIDRNNSTIMVTGDGGTSWHGAVTFPNGLPFEVGFTNPDSEGYVYGGSAMYKFKVTEWERVTRWVENPTI